MLSGLSGKGGLSLNNAHVSAGALPLIVWAFKRGRSSEKRVGDGNEV